MTKKGKFFNVKCFNVRQFLVKTSAFNRLLIIGVIIVRCIIGCLNHRFHSVSV